MTPRRMIDGNEAVTSVAHRLSDVIAIYPITPASPMGELSDQWTAEGRRTLWGTVPDVVEMQSEGGAAGAVHGALQAGALTTTFTASQGLLLMLPNMYKIAGELTSCCLHVAARTVATHALSIFCDHSDVMAARGTGWAFLCSTSVQEAHDFACLAHAVTLEARIPVLHFFDGFRTSHEIAGVEMLSDDTLRAMLDDRMVAEHRARRLTPDRPVIRGTAQNPDVFFQGREAANGYYAAFPDRLRAAMGRFGKLTGRSYDVVTYHGHPAAERVIVLMGSGAQTARVTAEHLAAAGEPVGVVAIRLYRPFPVRALAAALPATVTQIAVLDRTKEPGAPGEPLYLDVVAALADAGRLSTVRVVGGRYGLSSKEFTPAMAKAAWDHLATPTPRHDFTVGIDDDVGHTSIPVEEDFALPRGETIEAVFYGLGSDGTVGANKNTIKIIGEEAGRHAQGYFVYDSKKAGAVTISHLRFGPHSIEAPYLITQAGFVACHQFDLLDRLDVLAAAAPGAIVLLNAPFETNDVWGRLSAEAQEAIVAKGLRCYVIDAYRVAQEAGLGVRINTIMQACFFALSEVLPQAQALEAIKRAIEKTYGKRGPVVVQQNVRAVDQAVAHLHPLPIPAAVTATRRRPPPVPDEAPAFVRDVTGVMLAGRGDTLPVSVFDADGTWPTATSQWEKRALAREIPQWDAEVCIQCNWCALVCPHAAIRAKVYDESHLTGAPEGFRSTTFRGPDFKGMGYTIQVAPDDCTGCNLCVTVCPAKDKGNPRHKAIDMEPVLPIRAREREGYRFFLDLPEADRTRLTRWDAKQSQLLQPLFEYSGACAGCGETPYLKLLTQLFGDRLLIANATGCSSIYGGNLPTTPYAVRRDGRGPAWANSLFEDNAEFGLGMRLATDSLRRTAEVLLDRVAPALPEALVTGLRGGLGDTEAEIVSQRERVAQVRAALANIQGSDAARLAELADALVPKSIWLVGGDGWAYDIGYGGLDHVLSLGRKVNILVLDTEVYSNTGGQQSKATPLAAAAKFAVAGKATPKKDLGLEAMSYRRVYVAQVAMGANMNQVVAAFREADSYPGPALIIAHSPCIAHGYDLRHGADQQKLAAQTGAWPLYRYDPRRIAEGKPPLVLDSKAPARPLRDYLMNETRFRMVERIDPVRFRALTAAAERDARERFAVYQQLAGITVPQDDEPPTTEEA